MRVEGAARTGSTTGFWVRVLHRMHAAGLVSDVDLYRYSESAVEDPTRTLEAMSRIISARDQKVTLVLDEDHHPVASAAELGVFEEIVALLSDEPTFRCLIAGRRRSPLEALAAQAMIPSSLIDDELLSLDPSEVAELCALSAPDLPAAAVALLGKQLAVAGPPARRISTVALLLRQLRDPSSSAGPVTPPRIASLVQRARQIGARGDIGDGPLCDALILLARSPGFDADLAAELCFPDGAEHQIRRLQELGAGHWESSASGQTPQFRLEPHLRSDLLSMPLPADGARTRELHRRIARWCSTVRGDHLQAFDHAVRGRDLQLAERALLRAGTLDTDDATRVTDLLREIPASELHAHPVLALWCGLVLATDPATQKRAEAFLESALGLCDASAASALGIDRSLCEALASVVQRLLGRQDRMYELAARALPAIELLAQESDRSGELDDLVLAAVDQCATGLFAAEDFLFARHARLVQLELSERFGLLEHKRDALAHLALIAAVTGSNAEAADALARIDHGGLPVPAPGVRTATVEHLARAWALLDRGLPEPAMGELALVDGHCDLDDFWDLALAAEVLALVLLGRPHDAEERLRSVSMQRLSSRSLPSTRRRLRITTGLQQLAMGRIQDMNIRRGSVEESSSILALAAVNAKAAGKVQEAKRLLAESGLKAVTPVQRMIVAVVRTVIAADDRVGIDFPDAVSRLVAILRGAGVAWPVVLLPDDVRRQALDVPDVPEELSTAFGMFPALQARSFDALPAIPRLTAREHEILLLLLETESRAEIAGHLYVSVNTVKSQMRSLYTKLAVNTREQALSRAMEWGFMEQQRPLETWRPLEHRSAS
ncbi:LuxR C-terminal-related transcriptional regulator [Brachybacterium phenoliresistens]|uniref:LuxR C-terminal-related transcriptional regulator n=1 Tax=Brachybacterium phenoliresistens TaxID=396014 RepID=UPI0031D71A1C